jgi:DNA-binding phage protein
MQTRKKQAASIRRSVVLPRELLDRVLSCAEPELKTNINRLVITALEEYAALRKKRKFEKAMADMARDPHIIRESQRISKEFGVAEYDGLANWSWD